MVSLIMLKSCVDTQRVHIYLDGKLNPVRFLKNIKTKKVYFGENDEVIFVKDSKSHLHRCNLSSQEAVEVNQKI